jgi:phosphoribosylformylglycinamidine cyclo-ligase
MIVCVAPGDEKTTLETLRASGETAFPIGDIVPAEGSPAVDYSNAW